MSEVTGRREEGLRDWVGQADTDPLFFIIPDMPGNTGQALATSNVGHA